MVRIEQSVDETIGQVFERAKAARTRLATLERA